MAILRVLLVDARPASDAGIQWSELLHGTDVHLSAVSSTDQALTMLREKGRHELDLVVLGPDLSDPANSAGRLRGTLAERPLVILTRGDDENLHRSLAAPARLLGVRWTLIDVESNRAEPYLRATLAAVRDRRRLRTTLGRINTALSSQDAAELSKLHRYTTSQRFHAHLVRHSRDAVVATSPDGTIVAWNLAAEDLFGLERDEAIGRHVAEVGNEAWRKLASSLARAPTGGPAADPVEIRMDGRDLEVTVSWIEGDDSVADGLGMTVHDLTARKALERELAEARRLESLGVLAGGIAHVINNALAAVCGNTELLLGRGTEDEEQAECLADIQDSAQRAVELCSQMSALGGQEIHLSTRVDLSRLVREHESQLRGRLPKEVELRIDPADTLPSVLLDETHVRRILENLVTNAAEAMAEARGTIVIGVDARESPTGETRYEGLDGSFVELSVTDDGCGMDEETRGRAFEPFFSTKFTGRGLGLSVVLGLARTHGGVVAIHSTPGEGTEVRVSFPVPREEAS